MHHQFRSPDGPIEVTVARQGESWYLGSLEATPMSDGRLRILNDDGTVMFAHLVKVGDVWWVHVQGHTFKLERVEPGASDTDDGGGLTAPMPGKVLQVLVDVGQSVSAGTTLMVLEAMKMEHRIVAANYGTVTAVHFGAGDQVEQGVALLALEES
jgi:acetyl/propionyl-CoA carboxylase alpha subunit